MDLLDSFTYLLTFRFCFLGKKKEGLLLGILLSHLFFIFYLSFSLFFGGGCGYVLYLADHHLTHLFFIYHFILLIYFIYSIFAFSITFCLARCQLALDNCEGLSFLVDILIREIREVLDEAARMGKVYRYGVANYLRTWLNVFFFFFFFIF